MKRIFAYLSCTMMVLMLVACERSSPILKVIIQNEGSDAADHEYLIVYDHGKSAATDAFVPDDTVSYTAEFGAFVSNIVGNKIINTLGSTLLIDDYGRKIDADEIMTAIMQTGAASIDHSICQFTIITDGDRYFTFVKLNVNWQSPCILYEYNVADGSLTELCRWDGVDLMGISIV